MMKQIHRLFPLTPQLITITESGTWTCPATGTYRVRCYGACGAGAEGGVAAGNGGAGGGFAQVTGIIEQDTACTVLVTDAPGDGVTFTDDASFVVYAANGYDGLSGYGGGTVGVDPPQQGDVTYTGGTGGLETGGLSGAGGARATENGNGIDGGGVAGVGTDQDGNSGVGLGSGGSGGGMATGPATVGGVGDPGYITIQRIS